MDANEANRQLLIDIKEVFATPSGRRVLEYLQRRTTFSRCAVPLSGPVDPLQVVAEEARRGIVLDLMRKMETPLDSMETRKAKTEEDK